MWKFNPFKPKEQTGLEGRTIDIDNLKVQVFNVIAEGGFSCVYLARDVIHGSKQYALKHIICNDEESLELVMKEISVMKSLKGHPNVVTLYAHALLDMGRTKEAILVMELCEKSLVNVLDSRGAAFFEEKKILTIFRDVCNAVFAMHCQSPPIAHRDLKAENLLLGSDRLWKLCDFGSTTTNHKRFEKPEEMGIEEDNIRKHTTPAYRAPEMWDLFRRELLNEKVDIWALGCLLFRICYFKSAFDGESKLQILNGNYRIPDLPKYSSSITDLIRDMLQSSPDARPDITQVWFRVNDLLPEGLQKSLPDKPPEVQLHYSDALEGTSRPGSKSTTPAPRRSPPPPPSPVSQNSGAGESGGSLGAFWTTQHAQGSIVSEEKTRPKYDEGLTTNSSLRRDGSRSDRFPVSLKSSPLKGETLQPSPVQKNVLAKPADSPTKDFEINFFQGDLDQGADNSKAIKTDNRSRSQGDSFNDFVAEFSNSKLSPKSNIGKSEKEELLEAEVEKLKQQLAQVNTEKAEMTSKYEKLSAICRLQRQELQELKQAHPDRTPSPGRDAFKNQASPSSQLGSTPPQREKIKGTVFELQQGFDQGTPSPDAKPWKAFTDNPSQAASMNNVPKSVRTRNDLQNRQTNSGASTWGFESDNFRAAPITSSQKSSMRGGNLGNSQRFGESKKLENTQASQPAGWAGF